MTKPDRKKIPNRSGVYFFKTERDKILYVGKATHLRQRIASYFAKSANLAPAKVKLLAESDQVTWEVTDTETDALLLEAHYIKKYQPRYNVLLRDDKTYLSVKITDEDYPRVLTTRAIEKDGTYFGPFTDARAVKETLKTLRKFFPYRTRCKAENGRKCLDAHIGLCPGVCHGDISIQEYRKNIVRIKWFLDGKRGKVVEALRKELRKALGKTRLNAKDLLPPDRMRRGTEATYAKTEKLQTQLYYLEKTLALQRVLRYGEKANGDNVALAKILGLPKPPHRIEGYDISNLLGQQATASMVVFTDGVSNKSEYKKFKIKTVRGANDVAMIKETLRRRFAHNEWPTPDLVIVDGGRPQLNAALEVWRQCNLHVPLISLAKRREEIFTLASPDPLVLPRTSGALHLVQAVRDEAHRFCRAYHRLLRRKTYRKKN